MHRRYISAKVGTAVNHHQKRFPPKPDLKKAALKEPTETKTLSIFYDFTITPNTNTHTHIQKHEARGAFRGIDSEAQTLSITQFLLVSLAE